jgi:hypothetical protein
MDPSGLICTAMVVLTGEAFSPNLVLSQLYKN